MQVAVARHVEVVVDAVLVVECAAIDEGAFCIEEEDLGGGAGPQRGGEFFLLVMHVGSGDSRLGELGFDLFRRLAGKGVHEQQGHILRREFFFQFRDAGDVAFAHRAGGAGHEDDETLVVLEVTEAAALSVERGAGEVFDEASDPDIARF